MLSVILAAFHLIALGLGLGAVIGRGTALRGTFDAASLSRVFLADNLWALSAALWVGTGLWRYAGETEKSIAYYNGNYFFIAKISLFVLIVALEIWPIVTLIRWRRALRAGESPAAIAEPGAVRAIAAISHIQALLVVLIVFAAASMARGHGILAP
jgi:putative membrane protein